MMLARCKWNQLVAHHERRPDRGLIERRTDKVARGHTNNSERFALQPDGFSDNERIAIKLALPEAVTQHHHRMRPGRLIFFGEETAPKGHIRSKRIEVVGGNYLAEDRTRVPGKVVACRASFTHFNRDSAPRHQL